MLKDDWISIARYAWSFRLAILSFVSTTTGALLPLVDANGTAFVVLGALSAAAASLARLHKQANMSAGKNAAECVGKLKG